MAGFTPFTTQLGKPGSPAYYGALRPTYQDPVAYSSGSQPLPHPYGQQLLHTSLFGLGVAGIFGVGAYRPGGGENIFSRYYMPTIRTAEEFSPFRIGRTFQVSNFLSQWEDAAKVSRYLSLDTIRSSQALTSYYSKLTGVDLLAPAKGSGLLFHEGKLWWGNAGKAGIEKGEMLLAHASVMLEKHSSASRLAEAWARSLGADITSKTVLGEMTQGSVFSKPIQYLEGLGASAAEREGAFIFVGGHSAKDFAVRHLKALAAGGVERMNLVSRSLGEIVPKSVYTGLERLGVPARLLESFEKKGMGVAAGPAAETLLRLTGKWTAVGAGLYFGYDFLDNLLNKTVGVGPTKLGASAYVGTRLGIARVSDFTGLSALSRKQEEIAPGSTSLLKLGAFPLAGAAAGLAVHGLMTANLQQRLLARGSEDLLSVGIKATRIMERWGTHPQWTKKLADNVERWTAKSNLFAWLGKEMTPRKAWALAGAGVGLALVSPFLPGALLPQKGYQELSDEYSGKKLVAVRRGRWWEMGRSAWEGNNISYFRPSWYSLLMTNAREKGIYGSDVSALYKFFTNNFTYGLERAHYWDRPYPISGTAFQDVPLIGPLLAGTVGRLVKPPIRMHRDEYQSSQGYMYQPPAFGEHRATEMGELPLGSPISPYGVRGVLGEQAYRFQEMMGMWGFGAGTLKKMLTGEETLFSQETQLESSYRMYGAERSLWDMELGGGFHVGEVLRRIFPHRRRETPLYNPIRNTMPEWLPGPGDRSPDFLHGDPYTQVAMGEVRLPGKGFEAIYPEVAGLSPQDYPDIYKYKILADVAPYSSKTQQLQDVMVARKRAGELSTNEVAMLDTIEENRLALRDKKDFSPYLYEGKLPLTPWGMLGKYWETLAHTASNLPTEYLTPFSPFSKMVHMRTAEEDYEQSILYGTRNAFWEHPWSNFLKPTLTSSLHGVGSSRVPGAISDQREIEEYFDALKYIKYSRLMAEAREYRDPAALGEFAERKQETLAGLNPYTQTYSQIFRALPRRERDYFNAFSEETDPEKQQKILSMVPENERALFMARWRMAKLAELQSKKRKGEQLSKAAEDFINETYDIGRTAGAPRTRELEGEYQRTRLRGESYVDWWKRTRVLPKALAGRAVPGPDWVGWHPSVELDDIKFKLVEEKGYDFHDFDLWSSDEQNVARRPYINNQVLEEIDESMSQAEIATRLRDLLGGQVEDLDISVSTYPSHDQQYNVDMHLSHDRSDEVRRKLHRDRGN